MLNDTLIANFLEHLEHERCLSAHTIKNYKHDLENAALFFKKYDIQEWSAVKDETIRALIISNRKLKKLSRTINRQLSTLRTFYNYLIREEIVADNPATRIKVLKTPRQLPKPLDTDETARLLAFETSNSLSIRDAAILELLYSSGIRISELVALDLTDLDLKQGQMYVLGKGKKNRIALIGRFALQAIQKWLLVRLPLVEPQEKALFVNNKGKRLSIRAIQYRVYQIGLQQGLDTRVHPHRLRHSFASHLLESSGELRAVQELLGHASLNTTEIYTQLNFQHLATVYDKCHPRAQKKK